ncbi:MAG: DUF1015 domain-containing protein [Candidatus Wallbacteria bacterium HGW-Wallbacteria-1]|jgi:uncharacterized protein (DUF1015 family)|uniref:DUF1015 domain-containing protein n=1 Tax=Candidatus Wallbacteria bacterium HGW-Wallbacteria-1 TaxID=2013854 RepID=A0A2N1PNR2_9BACT|nr:MAG: DUF1015 domain-containing protein [Candidatus Wallbacteria bacterium HGW-Wallbacteria-1]
MAVIRPFRGLRPPREKASRVASFPYDVINSEEAREIASGNPDSFLHVVKPEIDLPADIELYDDRVYARACQNLDEFVAKGVLIQDEKRHFYVYRQIMGEHSQIGLVVCCHVKDYLEGRIKRHEFTRRDKEDDRTRHVSDTDVNAGPVFLTYRSNEKVNAIVNEVVTGKPEYDFISDDGIKHTLWLIEQDSKMAELTEQFSAISELYVADGHHRAASAARVGSERKEGNPSHSDDSEYNFFLAVLFPHDQLMILDYNRVVKTLNNHSSEEFMRLVGEKFEIRDEGPARYSDGEEGCFVPEQVHTFGMVLDGKWYSLVPKVGTYPENDPVDSLDVSILQKNLLAPILGIGDPRSDKNIDFVGGIRGRAHLVKLVENGGFKVAFAMCPTSIEQLMAIADAGEVMPPKSTWFEPKLRSGLVVHSLSENYGEYRASRAEKAPVAGCGCGCTCGN